jgi:hypothetical protein
MEMKMKTYIVTAKIVVDDTHTNAPDLEGCMLGVENALATPDNEEFGIESVVVTGVELDGSR